MVIFWQAKAFGCSDSPREGERTQRGVATTSSLTKEAAVKNPVDRQRRRIPIGSFNSGMCSKFIPQIPANAVATAKIAAQAASRFVTSPSSIVTRDRFTVIAVATLSRMVLSAESIRARWSRMSW